MVQLYVTLLVNRVLSAGVKNLDLSGEVMGLGVGDISSLEHVPVVPGHPAVGV